MEYFTDLIGKQIVSIFDQKIVGTLLNIEIDWTIKKAKKLIVLGTDDETIYLLSPQKVYHTSDCITIRNSADLIITVEPDYAPIIGTKILGISGKTYGKLNEISFENWRLQLLYANEPVDIKKIFSYSAKLLLINDLDKKIFLHNFKPKNIAIPTEYNQTVSILESISSVGMPKTITAQTPKSK